MDHPGSSNSAPSDLCNLCNTRKRAYTCPRCGIGYCNVECYKSEAHLDCSESFYKQCVEEELKSRENDPESRQRMVEILRRVHNEDVNEEDLESGDEESPLDSDDEEVPNLEDRLRNVNLDNADELWSVLTEAERQEFEALIKNGEAEKLLPQWVPWWTHKAKKKLIVDLEKEEDTVDYLKECPKLVDVPIFNELQKASPNVRFNIINVVYAYAYVALYYNGDYLNTAEEATIVFLDVCENMKKNTVYEDVESAVDGVFENITNCDWLPQDEETLLTCREAGSQIMEGPEDANRSLYVSAALSELHRLLCAAKEEISASKKAGNRDFSKRFLRLDKGDFDLSKKSLLLYRKKTEYYLSWIKSYGNKMP